ncbi:hypothetical protein Tco_0716016 [Tanacetum coccineum]
MLGLLPVLNLKTPTSPSSTIFQTPPLLDAAAARLSLIFKSEGCGYRIFDAAGGGTYVKEFGAKHSSNVGISIHCTPRIVAAQDGEYRITLSNTRNRQEVSGSFVAPTHPTSMVHSSNVDNLQFALCHCIPVYGSHIECEQAKINV